MPSIQMPQDLQEEKDAQEVIRVWFDDGRMDLSHRMAQICALNTAREPEDCFQEIVRGLKTRLGMINEGGDDA